MVEITPFTRSKTDCVPQKHPPANTAVCLPGVGANAASFAAGGTGAFVAARHPAHTARVTSTDPIVWHSESPLSMNISRARILMARTGLMRWGSKGYGGVFEDDFAATLRGAILRVRLWSQGYVRSCELHLGLFSFPPYGRSSSRFNDPHRGTIFTIHAY